MDDEPNRTVPNDRTQQAEREEARRAGEPDRMPTDEEARRAEDLGDADPQVAAHYEEMAERGAQQKGEGRLP